MTSRPPHLIGPFLCGVASLLLLLLDPAGAHADGSTNRLFGLAGGSGELSTAETTELVLRGADGKYGREFLPAEEDPAGNWGPVTNGVQISARFYQTNFAVGDTVSVVILYRNKGPTPVPGGSDSSVNYPYFLSLRRGAQTLQPLVPQFNSNPDGSAWYGEVPPGTQLRDTLRLDKIFDLGVTGTYELTAERGVRVKGSRSARARSGTARFAIVPAAQDGGKGLHSNTNSLSPTNESR